MGYPGDVILMICPGLTVTVFEHAEKDIKIIVDDFYESKHLLYNYNQTEYKTFKWWRRYQWYKSMKSPTDNLCFKLKTL